MTEPKLQAGARQRLVKGAAWCLAGLGLAYLAQFVLGTIMSKGESPMGAAFETIAYEAFRKQYDGSPEMRVVGAGASPTLCSFWNFEWTWGQCVAIVVEVRDYEPDYHPEQLRVIERELEKLGQQMRKPCELLGALRIHDQARLAREIGCSSHRSFRFRIHANAVTVVSKRGLPDRPHRWQVSDRKHITLSNFEGEL